MKQAATTADRLDPCVSEELGYIMNEKNPKLASEIYRRKSIECLEVSQDSIASFCGLLYLL